MFCIKCGTQLPDNAAFCFECGSKVEETPEIKSELVQEPVERYGIDVAQSPKRASK